MTEMKTDGDMESGVGELQWLFGWLHSWQELAWLRYMMNVTLSTLCQ